GAGLCAVRGFFFFPSRRRHTSFSRDWSSDVCSSDLESEEARIMHAADAGHERRERADDRHEAREHDRLAAVPFVETLRAHEMLRSEERRVGKECRSRWSAKS